MPRSGPARLAAAVAHIDHHGGTITVRDGRPFVRVLPGTPRQDRLRAVLSSNRDLLLAVAVGRQPIELKGEKVTHELVPCDKCGEPSMVAITDAGERPGGHVWPRCRMTPGCLGRHQPERELP
jgi:hypothetical protein